MRSLDGRAIAEAERVGGELCLDFANTVAGWTRRSARPDFGMREDRMLEYDDLLAWSSAAGGLERDAAIRLQREARRRPAEATAVLARAGRLRLAIYRAGWLIGNHRAPLAEDLQVLTDEVAVARRHERLEAQGTALSWRTEPVTSQLDAPLWPIALSAARYFSERDLTRLRVCPGDSCGWLFADTTRNRSRHWCDMRVCGNLAKVRRFRSRET
jgi:predicted RNA-binding Zn ribbon-like protein